jgi:hypothetical protein
MNTFIFINGPNGVGKSTVCKALHQRLSPSAWLESEWCRMTNPFVWNEEIISLTTANITHMLRSYLACPWLDYVIFAYGFHGPRQRIWDTVFGSLQDLPHRFMPITLTCDETENIARMTRDGRDGARIQRAMAVRHLYDGLPYPTIDTTALTVDQSVDRILVTIESAAT